MSDDSLSDDSNLSSTSLVKDLIEKSLTEVSSFYDLTFEEKFDKVRTSVKTSFLHERDPTSMDAYDQEVDEYLTRTTSDRKKSFHEGAIPRLSERGIRKRTFSRPNIDDLQIPMLSKKRVTSSSWSEQKSRRSGYVGELLNYMDTRASRFQIGRRSSVHLKLYKKRLEEENLKKGTDTQLENLEDDEYEVQNEENNDQYTKEQKEIIEEVLGDIPKRRESVFVPYGKLSYLQDVKADKDPTDTRHVRRPSYDEYFSPSDDLSYLQRILPSLDVNPSEDQRHSIWEREPSFKSVKTLNETEKEKDMDKEKVSQKGKRRGSVWFSEP